MSLLQYVEKCSYRLQLLMLFISTFALLSAASMVLTIYVANNALDRHSIEAGENIAKTFAQNAKLAIIYESPKNAENAAAVAWDYPDVDYVAVFSRDGREIYSKGGSPTWSPSLQDMLAAKQTTTRAHGNKQHFVTPVVLGQQEGGEAPFSMSSKKSETIGYAHIVLSRESLTHLQKSIITNTLIFTLLSSIGLSILLSRLIRRLINPINRLASTISDTQENEYSVRATEEGPPEIVRMAAAFNRLMELLQEQDNDIRYQRDILEVEVVNRTAELLDARDNAVQASNYKSEFLAMVSHELRTPLSSAFSSAELLHDAKRLDAGERELVRVIQDSIRMTLKEVDRVLDFTKIEAGKMSADSLPFDLHQVLGAAMEITIPAARIRKLRVIHRTSAPFLLVGDDRRLLEVLNNLLSNAIKFTESGSVSLWVYPLQTTAETTRIRFEVRDTGIGIAKDAMNSIWQSFTQEDRGIARRYGGSGLGTTIARHLVTLMGGEIGATSVKGAGSLFWFELPFERQPDSVSREADVPGGRVLLLTDDEAVGSAYTAHLSSMRGILTTTASPIEARAMIERSTRLDNCWHLLLIDSRLTARLGQTAEISTLVAFAEAAKVVSYLVDEDRTKPAPEMEYAGRLGRVPDTIVFACALHAAPLYGERASPHGVVRLVPTGRRSTIIRHVPILVVDDNRTSRLIMRRILENAEYDVDDVTDGEDALHAMLSGKYRAVILDLHMPDVDGVSLVNQYCVMEPGPKIPVIMLSADVTFEAKRLSASAGVKAFLTKPVSTADLLGVMNRVLAEGELVQFTVHRDSSNANEAPLPIIDPEVVRSLYDIYAGSDGYHALVETFETEVETGIRRLGECLPDNYTGFIDHVFSMKVSAVDVGAARLTAKCEDAIRIKEIDFPADAAAALLDLKTSYQETRAVIRELMQPRQAPHES